MNITAKELNTDHFGKTLTIQTTGRAGYQQPRWMPVTINGILTSIESSADYITENRLCSAELYIEPNRPWVELTLANPLLNTEPESYTIRLTPNTPITIQEEQ